MLCVDDSMKSPSGLGEKDSCLQLADEETWTCMVELHIVVKPVGLPGGCPISPLSCGAYLPSEIVLIKLLGLSYSRMSTCLIGTEACLDFCMAESALLILSQRGGGVNFSDFIDWCLCCLVII